MKINNQSWNFENSYIELPKTLYKKQLPVPVIDPQLVYLNIEQLNELGLNYFVEDKQKLVDYLSGNKVPEGSIPIAQAYAGHQFGNFTMLGDGRAILLGEQINHNNQRYDIQLKGSGQTPFSRNGDGRATLSSMLREYLMSECVYYLGVPSTRSLAVIETGEKVLRGDINSGGILTRISSSHIRVGTFEYVSHFCPKEELDIFIKYVINRHFPEIIESKNLALQLLKVVMNKQIDLIVNWNRIGFIHGVMNTDNMSIVGETIDYGPCAFMNIYNPETVFSSIDRNGRYAFGNQSKIAYWNLSVFAGALLPSISDNREDAIKLAENILSKFPEIYSKKWYKMMFKKLGILNPITDDIKLVDSLLELMKESQADYTNTFAALALDKATKDSLFKLKDFKTWMKTWEGRVESKKTMKNYNPLFIPRNHLVESALKDAVLGNKKQLDELLYLSKNPYSYKNDFDDFQTSPEGFDSTYKTFCGT